MKKYTPVFGPQELFDNAPEHVEVIRFNDYSKEYLWGDLNTVKLLTSKELKVIPIVAMRRIVRTPIWSLADQKAGRLPEVGSLVEYFANNEHDDTEVTAQWRGGDELEILRHQNKNKAFAVFNRRTEQSSNLIIDCMRPIKIPEEKAARLREEWFSEATLMTTYEIYDALLSGELPMPGKWSE